MSGYTGERVVLEGQTTVWIRLGDCTRPLRFYVAKDGTENLLDFGG